MCQGSHSSCLRMAVDEDQRRLGTPVQEMEQVMDVVEVEPENACSIAPVVDVLFSRWTTPILWTLNQFGRQRFSELERRISTISPKVLTQRLRQLERDGLIVRTYYAEVPPRVEYEISELGGGLAGLFANLTQWGLDNLPEVETARGRFDSTHQGKLGHTPRPRNNG